MIHQKKVAIADQIRWEGQTLCYRGGILESRGIGKHP